MKAKPILCPQRLAARASPIELDRPKVGTQQAYLAIAQTCIFSIRFSNRPIHPVFAPPLATGDPTSSDSGLSQTLAQILLQIGNSTGIQII